MSNSTSLKEEPFVKIWFSKDAGSPLGAQINEERLKKLRQEYEDKPIHLIFSKNTLSEASYRYLKLFCHQYQITLHDIDEDILPKLQGIEKELFTIMKLEIEDENGCLAAASDIARVLTPVLELGIYSDFDLEIPRDRIPDQLPNLWLNTMLRSMGESEEAERIIAVTNDLIYAKDPKQNEILADIQKKILINYQENGKNEEELKQFFFKRKPPAAAEYTGDYDYDDALYLKRRLFIDCIVMTSGPNVWHETLADKYCAGKRTIRGGIPEDLLLKNNCLLIELDSEKMDASWIDKKAWQEKSKSQFYGMSFFKACETVDRFLNHDKKKAPGPSK